jgi:hypothetical protein
MKLSNSLTVRLDSRKGEAFRLKSRLETLLNSRPEWSPMECGTYVLNAGLDAIERHETTGPVPDSALRKPALAPRGKVSR